MNEKAALKIGNEIFILKGDNEYLIKDGDFKTYNDIQNGSENTSLSNVQIRRKIFTEETLKSTSKDGNIQITAIPAFQGTRSYYSPEYNNGRPERVYMEIYSQSFAVYASQGVLVRGQAYRRGGVFGSRSWRNDEMYRARMSGLQPIPETAWGQTPFDTGWVFGQEEVNYTIRRWDGRTVKSFRKYLYINKLNERYDSYSLFYSH